MVHNSFVVRVKEVKMSMLKPNDNTILWTQILEIPRHVTRAFGNLEQGGGNGLAMDAKARENRRNVRG